jgi:hypothetical protein
MNGHRGHDRHLIRIDHGWSTPTASPVRDRNNRLQKRFRWIRWRHLAGRLNATHRWPAASGLSSSRMKGTRNNYGDNQNR